jgi:precorrin-3B methylase
LRIEIDGKMLEFVREEDWTVYEPGETWRAYLEQVEGDESLARLLDSLVKADAWICLVESSKPWELIEKSLEIVADGDVAPELVEEVKLRKADLIAYLERSEREAALVRAAINDALRAGQEAREAELNAWLDKTGTSLDVDSD